MWCFFLRYQFHTLRLFKSKLCYIYHCYYCVLAFRNKKYWSRSSEIYILFIQTSSISSYVHCCHWEIHLILFFAIKCTTYHYITINRGQAWAPHNPKTLKLLLFFVYFLNVCMVVRDFTYHTPAQPEDVWEDNHNVTVRPSVSTFLIHPVKMIYRLCGMWIWKKKLFKKNVVCYINKFNRTS